jgi:4-amino-4-deoxy-L-arabinose transferase-like glycosyltransferase
LLRRFGPARLVVALQLVALVVLAGATVQRFHIWAVVDEAAHYDYVMTVADDRRLPVITDFNHPEVRAIADLTYPKPSPRDPATLNLESHSYEAFQPPLYYVLAAPSFRLASDHITKARFVRLFDALLLFAAAGVVFLLARAVLPDPPLLGFAAGLNVLLWPGVIVRSVTISPTALELLVVSALLLVLWRVQEGRGRRWVIAAGALAGTALLTKTTLVYMLPLAGVVLAWDWWRRRDTVALLIAAALPLVMLAPWLAFNRDHYGSWTANAQAHAQQRPNVNPTNRSYGFAEVKSFTRRLFDNVLATEWAGQLDVGWIQIAVLGVDVLLFGAWVLLVALRRRGPPARTLWFFGVPVIVGYASLVVILLGERWPSFNLRYLYAALPGLAIAVAAALPVRRAWWVVGASALLVAALWLDMAGAFYFQDIGNALGI